MKKFIPVLLTIVLFSITLRPIDRTSPSIKNYEKAMRNYYLYSDIKKAKNLFTLAIKRDETFLAAYLGLARVYFKIGWKRHVKRVYDRAWQDCRTRRQRKTLIVAKARLLHDVLNNRPKARAFMKWAIKHYDFRQAQILKRRYYLRKNTILRFPELKRGAKSWDLWGKKYKNRKFSFLFWHPNIPEMKSLIYKWRRKSRRLGFIPVLFTPVGKTRAYSFLRRQRIRFNTFYSQDGQDIARIFGIDLVPHCYYLGRYKEILYSGHPDNVSFRLARKLKRL